MPASYCLRCGGPLEHRWLSHDERKRLVCRRCDYVHYENSKPCAGALVVQDGKVLLVRRLIEPFFDHWDIPGGFLEVGEHPADGAVREVAEETGLVVEPTALHGIYMDTYGPSGDATLNVYYLARVTGGAIRPSEETGEIGWFGPDELPERIAFDNCQQALVDWKVKSSQSSARKSDH